MLDTTNTVQLNILERRFNADPKLFQAMFVAEGLAQLHAAFDAGELSEAMTLKIWELLEREDTVGRIMMRFLWNLPLGKKRVFIRAIDTWLSGRYPMFAGEIGRAHV